MKRYLLLLFTIFFFTFSIDVKADYTVYVTKTGECYHIAGCSYLKSSIPISLEDAKDRGYRPCSRCKPNSNLGETYTTKNSATTTARSVPKDDPTPKPTKTIDKNQKAENDDSFWENAFYFAVGGGVVYGISKKSRKE